MSILGKKSKVTRLVCPSVASMDEASFREGVLAANVFREIGPDEACESSWGFAPFNNVECGRDTILNDVVAVPGYCVFRVAFCEKRVPSSALRTAVRDAIEAMKPQTIKSAAKKALTADIKLKLLQRALPSSSSYTMCVHLKSGVVFTDIPVGRKLDRVVSYFCMDHVPMELSYRKAVDSDRPFSLLHSKFGSPKAENEHNMSHFLDLLKTGEEWTVDGVAVKVSGSIKAVTIAPGGQAVNVSLSGAGAEQLRIHDAGGVDKHCVIKQLGISYDNGDNEGSGCVSISSQPSFCFTLPVPEGDEVDGRLSYRLNQLENAYKVLDKLYLSVIDTLVAPQCEEACGLIKFSDKTDK